MAGSLRSKARPAGRCGVQPNSCSRRQVCTVEYLTPHSRSIRSATRQAVQRLVPYPKASGPRFKPCTMRCRSAAVSWRPARPRRALQSLRSALLHLPRPAIHRLAVHSDPACHLRLVQTLFEQTRRLQASPLEFRSITFNSRWMSHAGEYNGNSRSCHYIM